MSTTTPSPTGATSLPQPSKAMGSYTLRGRPATSNGLSQHRKSPHIPPTQQQQRRAVSTDSCIDVVTSTSSSGNTTAIIAHPPPPPHLHHTTLQSPPQHPPTSSTESAHIITRATLYGIPVASPTAPSGTSSARATPHCRPLSTEVLLSPLYPPSNNTSGSQRKLSNSGSSRHQHSRLHQSINSPVTSMISSPGSNTEPFDEIGVHNGSIPREIESLTLSFTPHSHASTWGAPGGRDGGGGGGQFPSMCVSGEEDNDDEGATTSTCPSPLSSPPPTLSSPGGKARRRLAQALYESSPLGSSGRQGSHGVELSSEHDAFSSSPPNITTTPDTASTVTAKVITARSPYTLPAPSSASFSGTLQLGSPGSSAYHSSRVLRNGGGGSSFMGASSDNNITTTTIYNQNSGGGGTGGGQHIITNTSKSSSAHQKQQPSSGGGRDMYKKAKSSVALRPLHSNENGISGSPMHQRHLQEGNREDANIKKCVISNNNNTILSDNSGDNVSIKVPHPHSQLKNSSVNYVVSDKKQVPLPLPPVAITSNTANTLSSTPLRAAATATTSTASLNGSTVPSPSIDSVSSPVLMSHENNAFAAVATGLFSSNNPEDNPFAVPNEVLFSSQTNPDRSAATTVGSDGSFDSRNPKWRPSLTLPPDCASPMRRTDSKSFDQQNNTTATTNTHINSNSMQQHSPSLLNVIGNGGRSVTGGRSPLSLTDMSRSQHESNQTQAYLNESEGYMRSSMPQSSGSFVMNNTGEFGEQSANNNNHTTATTTDNSDDFFREGSFSVVGSLLPDLSAPTGLLQSQATTPHSNASPITTGVIDNTTTSISGGLIPPQEHRGGVLENGSPHSMKIGGSGSSTSALESFKQALLLKSGAYNVEQLGSSFTTTLASCSSTAAAAAAVATSSSSAAAAAVPPISKIPIGMSAKMHVAHCRALAAETAKAGTYMECFEQASTQLALKLAKNDQGETIVVQRSPQISYSRYSRGSSVSGGCGGGGQEGVLPLGGDGGDHLTMKTRSLSNFSSMYSGSQSPKGVSTIHSQHHHHHHISGITHIVGDGVLDQGSTRALLSKSLEASILAGATTTTTNNTFTTASSFQKGVFGKDGTKEDDDKNASLQSILQGENTSSNSNTFSNALRVPSITSRRSVSFIRASDWLAQGGVRGAGSSSATSASTTTHHHHDAAPPISAPSSSSLSSRPDVHFTSPIPTDAGLPYRHTSIDYNNSTSNNTSLFNIKGVASSEDLRQQMEYKELSRTSYSSASPNTLLQGLISIERPGGSDDGDLDVPTPEDDTIDQQHGGGKHSGGGGHPRLIQQRKSVSHFSLAGGGSGGGLTHYLQSIAVIPPSKVTTSGNDVADLQINSGRIVDDDFEVLNQYIILKEIGRGASGIVYLALDTEEEESRRTATSSRAATPRSTNTADVVVRKDFSAQTVKAKTNTRKRGHRTNNECLVAVKAVPVANTIQLNRIEHEIAMMKSIRHANVVTLREVIHDTEEGMMYLVMDYIPLGPIVELTSTPSCSVAAQSVSAVIATQDNRKVSRGARKSLSFFPDGSMAASISIDRKSGRLSITGADPSSSSGNNNMAHSSSPTNGNSTTTTLMDGVASQEVPMTVPCYCEPVRPLATTLASYVRQITRGLHYLHRECGVLHRDLKPDNILVGHAHFAHGGGGTNNKALLRSLSNFQPEASEKHRLFLADFGVSASLTPQHENWEEALLDDDPDFTTSLSKVAVSRTTMDSSVGASPRSETVSALNSTSARPNFMSGSDPMGMLFRPSMMGGSGSVGASGEISTGSLLGLPPGAIIIPPITSTTSSPANTSIITNASDVARMANLERTQRAKHRQSLSDSDLDSSDEFATSSDSGSIFSDFEDEVSPQLLSGGPSMLPPAASTNNNFHGDSFATGATTTDECASSDVSVKLPQPVLYNHCNNNNYNNNDSDPFVSCSSNSVVEITTIGDTTTTSTTTTTTTTKTNHNDTKGTPTIKKGASGGSNKKSQARRRRSPIIDNSRPNEIGGTPSFMPPEAFDASHPLTPASDVWSLGVITYLMLFGQLPFLGRTMREVVRAVCGEPGGDPYSEVEEANKLYPPPQYMWILEEDEDRRNSFSTATLSTTVNSGHLSITTTNNNINNSPAAKNSSSSHSQSSHQMYQISGSSAFSGGGTSHTGRKSLGRSVSIIAPEGHVDAVIFGGGTAVVAPSSSPASRVSDAATSISGWGGSNATSGGCNNNKYTAAERQELLVWWGLVKRMLRRDPKLRITTSQLLRHPLISPKGGGSTRPSMLVPGDGGQHT